MSENMPDIKELNRKNAVRFWEERAKSVGQLIEQCNNIHGGFPDQETLDRLEIAKVEYEERARAIQPAIKDNNANPTTTLQNL